MTGSGGHAVTAGADVDLDTARAALVAAGVPVRAGADPAMTGSGALLGALGATGAMIAVRDWAATPLGPPADWPAELWAAVGTCLPSRIPMLLWWGPDLVQIYNDAYRRFLGTKHPRALGEPAAECWAEVWPDVGALAEQALHGGTATYAENLPLVMERNGFAEETYWTFSYSPVHDRVGAVRGVFVATNDVTPRVLADRRLRTLHELARISTADTDTLQDAAAAAVAVLDGDRPDLPFVAAYLDERGGTRARLVAVHGVAAGGPMAPRSVADPTGPAEDPGGAPASVAPAVRRALREARPQRVEGLRAAGPYGFVPEAGAPGAEVPDAAVVLPLMVGGGARPAGALLLGISPYRPFDADYRGFLGLVAGQVSTALGAARRARDHERTRAIALGLQHAMLGPTELPPGFAVRYEAAVQPLEVGGDWYDVVDLDDGRIGVAVGDSVGQGLDAAVVMGQLRSACRALLLRGTGPAQVLADLDGFIRLVPVSRCSTVFCGIIDPAAGVLTYSRAGHPPGVVVDADGHDTLLEDGGSVPLGVVPGIVRPEATAELPAGSTLLLFTDGLVERRGTVVDDGIDAARRVVRRHARDEPGVVAERLVTDLRPSAGQRDDVAVLVYRQPRSGTGPGPLRIEVPAAPSSLSQLRHRLGDWCAAAGLSGELVDDLVLAASEAATNAVEHAGLGPDATIVLTAGLHGDRLEVEVADRGRWRPAPADPGFRGRGLAVIRAIVDEVSVEHDGGGTTVRLTCRVP